MGFRYIDADTVYNNLDMQTCIDLMEDVFASLGRGEIENKLRSVLPVESNKIFGIMPGLIPYNNCVGAKLITVFHENFKQKMPSHQGVVVLFSTQDGSVLGAVDGMAITAIRTAAVSAVATKYLSNENSHTLALLGAGVQAATHLNAITKVRDIKKVNVWSVFPDEAKDFIEKQSANYPEIEFTCHLQGEYCASDADIICTVTSSHTPILKGEWMKKGAHINAVGACAKNDRELDTNCVQISKFVCDNHTSCVNESGDYLYPLNEGVITENHILCELGKVVCQQENIRKTEQDITVFEALGLAVEDIACAYYLLNNL